MSEKIRTQINYTLTDCYRTIRVLLIVSTKNLYLKSKTISEPIAETTMMPKM